MAELGARGQSRGGRGHDSGASSHGPEQMGASGICARHAQTDRGGVSRRGRGRVGARSGRAKLCVLEQGARRQRERPARHANPCGETSARVVCDHHRRADAKCGRARRLASAANETAPPTRGRVSGNRARNIRDRHARSLGGGCAGRGMGLWRTKRNHHPRRNGLSCPVRRLRRPRRMCFICST